MNVDDDDDVIIRIVCRVPTQSVRQGKQPFVFAFQVLLVVRIRAFVFLKVYSTQMSLTISFT